MNNISILNFESTLPEIDLEHGFSIDWNTAIIFQYLNFEPLLYSTYIACKNIKHNITVEKIQDRLKLIEKEKNLKKLTPKKIQDHINQLKEKNYLTRGTKKKNLYYLVSEKHPNQKNIQKFNIRFKNFLNSKLIFKKYQIKEYINSKINNYKDLIFGEIVSKYYFEVPVAYNQIETELLIKRHQINKIQDLKSEEIRIQHFNKQDTAFKGINFNYATIGKKYYKNFHLSNSKVNKKIKEKIEYDERNLINIEDGELLDHFQKVSLIKEEKGKHKYKSLSNREKRSYYPAWFSQEKREWFLPKLSEKLVINDLKRDKNKIRSRIESESKKFLFNSPETIQFHLHK